MEHQKNRRIWLDYVFSVTLTSERKKIRQKLFFTAKYGAITSIKVVASLESLPGVDSAVNLRKN